jgi:hypothetical protein
MVRLALAVILLLLATPQGRAQTAPPTPPAATATAPPAADAQKALAILKDPAKLADLVAVLEALAKAKPDQPAATAPLPPESLGAQLLMDSSRRLASFSEDLVATFRTVTDFPLLWRFAEQLVTDPLSRGLLLSTGWRLALVFVAGLGAQWVMRRLLHRPMRALAAHAEAKSAAAAETAGRRGVEAAEAGETEPPQRRSFAPLAILRRVPAALGRLVLDLCRSWPSSRSATPCLAPALAIKPPPASSSSP